MIKIEQHPAVTFDDVLIVPQRSSISSRSEIDVSWSLGEWKFDIPIIAANMDTICGEKMAIKMAEMGGLGIIHRYMSVQEYGDIAKRWSERFSFTKPLALSVGLVSRDKERIVFCVDQADIICVDVAHGDTTQMIDTLKFIRESGFDGPIIAGNVCTPEGTSNLSIGGADLIKVGVGPGSVCTTRVKTGCGYPQLQAVTLCGGEAPIIADGGIKTPGDVAKALAAGARVVMIGGLLAGTDCVPGWDEATKNWEENAYQQFIYGSDGKVVGTVPIFPTNKAIKFRGMASKEAREEMGFAGINAEGISTFVKCKEPGSTEAVINDIVEGIKSAMSYTGAENLEVFKNKAKFVRVTTTSQLENRPHFSG